MRSGNRSAGGRNGVGVTVGVGVDVGVDVAVGVDVGVGVNVAVGVLDGVGVRVATKRNRVRGLEATDTDVAVGLSDTAVGRTVAVETAVSALINRGASQKAIVAIKHTDATRISITPNVGPLGLDGSDTDAGGVFCTSGGGCTGTVEKNGHDRY